MKQVLKKHTISFKNAFNGLLLAVKTQPNFRVHLILSVLAIIGGFFLKISFSEWLAIIILIFMGLTIEMINTAIEATTDAITYEWKEEIKIAKDVSSGAMLLFAIGAFLIAIIIFLPKIFSLI